MLIGLCGAPNTGKSEVRRILTEQYGFHLLDTKEILRNMAALLTGLEPQQFLTQFAKQQSYNGVTRRKIMGELGNVAERLWGDFFMIERALDQGWNYPDKNIVVDALRKTQPLFLEGAVIEVVSDRAIDTGNDFDLYEKPENCYTIYNNGSIEDLEVEVAKAADRFRF